MQLVIGNNTKENLLWESENKCHISQNCSLHKKNSEVYLRFKNSCEI